MFATRPLASIVSVGLFRVKDTSFADAEIPPTMRFAGGLPSAAPRS